MFNFFKVDNKFISPYFKGKGNNNKFYIVLFKFYFLIMFYTLDLPSFYINKLIKTNV